MDSLKRKKEELIIHLIQEGYLKTQKIIDAFKEVPRELFVTEKYKNYSYIDEPLPIMSGQTISAPHMVAMCTELLKPKPSDIALEVGAGSGYQSAILARLVKKIITVELEKELVVFARQNLSKAGIKNVFVCQGDGSKGYPDQQPYDKIIVTCACPEIPKPLIEQLKTGGIIVVPIGEYTQDLIVGIKTKIRLKKKSYGRCVFVPLRH